MLEIPLTKGYSTIVDDEDAHLAEYQWVAQVNRGGIVYARGTVNGRKVLLHRLIMDEPEGLYVDHIDRDGLNNLRSNLRVATTQQNGHNAKVRRTSKTKLKGVEQKKKKFRAYISIDGQKRHLGSFTTAFEAAKAYDEAATRYFGEFARTNAA